ncbi:MAG: hypothetical protein EA361_01870 [Bacteroidetes bacterium]|nr:MAG: hypothetical protein EA361_01870 [Bacteroidota bacterium]
MFQKFIINDGRLKAGLVDQHRELAEDHSTTQGGGWWYMDVESRTIWLYGKSILFGSVPKNLLQQVIASGQHDYPDCTWYFSRSSKLEHAMQKAERLGLP